MTYKVGNTLSAINKLEATTPGFMKWLQADLEREGRDRASKSIDVALAKAKIAIHGLHSDHLGTALLSKEAGGLIEEWCSATEALVKAVKLKLVVTAAPAEEVDEEYSGELLRHVPPFIPSK